MFDSDEGERNARVPVLKSETRSLSFSAGRFRLQASGVPYSAFRWLDEGNTG